MLNTVKKQLRKIPAVVHAKNALRKAVMFPLRFTSLNVLNPEKIPFKDLFDTKKISLLKTVQPYSKNGYARLSNVYDLATEMEEKHIPGAFIECGVYKGGCCAIMGEIAHRYGNHRTTWYLDSFEGMPAVPSEKDGAGTESIAGDVLKASVADVEELVFGKLQLFREKNKIVKGWFEQVLPAIKKDIGPIALLRLDADWYEATKCILEELFDQVVPGGYLIFDDYARWVGSRQAVDDFFASRGVKPDMKFIGSVDNAYNRSLAPMYFQKR